jgi:hypothetical protein
MGCIMFWFIVFGRSQFGLKSIIFGFDQRLLISDQTGCPDYQPWRRPQFLCIAH